MDRVRLAIVGCGSISSLNAAGYLEHEACEVVALCDPDLERCRRRAREWGVEPKLYRSYEEVLADPDVDAVELLTPTHLHAAQSVAALEAGKHVSCQKPMAATVAEADEIAAAVARAGTVYRVTENFLYYPPIVKAKELLDQGAIGEPSLLRIRTVRGFRTVDASALRVEPGADEWRRDAEANPGGSLYDDGWHKFATAMWWLGAPELVSGMVTRTDDYLIDAPSAVTWKFRDRSCLGVFDYAYMAEMPMRSKYYPLDEFFEIQGSRGAIWVTRCTGEWLDMAPVVLVTEDGMRNIECPSDWIEGFKGAARSFVDSILDGSQPDMDADFGRRVLQATLAAYRASETGRAVDPQTVTQES